MKPSKRGKRNYCHRYSARNRPALLSCQKGMRPEGVYVRQGYSSVPATDNAIRRMIKETDGDRFEAMRSLNQNLTFEATKKNLIFVR